MATSKPPLLWPPVPSTRHFNKTKLCTFIQQGKCKRGATCTYAHRLEEIQNLPEFSRTLLCRSFMRGRKCSHGDSCNYAHGEEQLRSAGPQQNKSKMFGGQGPKLSEAKGSAPSILGDASSRVRQDGSSRHGPNAVDDMHAVAYGHHFLKNQDLHFNKLLEVATDVTPTENPNDAHDSSHVHPLYQRNLFDHEDPINLQQSSADAYTPCSIGSAFCLPLGITSGPRSSQDTHQRTTTSSTSSHTSSNRQFESATSALDDDSEEKDVTIDETAAEAAMMKLKAEDAAALGKNGGLVQSRKRRPPKYIRDRMKKNKHRDEAAAYVEEVAASFNAATPWEKSFHERPLEAFLLGTTPHEAGFSMFGGLQEERRRRYFSGQRRTRDAHQQL